MSSFPQSLKRSSVVVILLVAGAFLAPALPACFSDVGNYDCDILGIEVREICDGKDNDCDGLVDEELFECDPKADFTPTVVCTDKQRETESCGGCGTRSRSCRPDLFFTDWSECADPCGCDAGGEPTWQTSIKKIMFRRCVRCHSYCRTYTGIQWVVQNGDLQWYTERRHYINGTERTDLLRWIEIGVPEAPCDLVETQ